MSIAASSIRYFGGRVFPANERDYSRSIADHWRIDRDASGISTGCFSGRRNYFDLNSNFPVADNVGSGHSSSCRSGDSDRDSRSGGWSGRKRRRMREIEYSTSEW